MSNELFTPDTVRRALVLGFVLFAVFALAFVVLWVAGTALGLGRVPAFLVAVCLGPVLVAGGVLLRVMALPLERRQALLGVSPRKSTDADESDRTSA
ncbi:MAG: hypothetical protein Kow0077_06110 [Anaerolineae bacterium]